jgi:hypothetical protein
MSANMTQDGNSGTTRFIPFQAYPNPAHDRLTIYFDSTYQIKGEDIQLLDMMGRRVLVQSSLNLNGSYVTMEVGYLPKGFYLVRILLNNEYKVVKFIKM